MDLLHGVHLKKVILNTGSQLAIKFLTSGTTLTATLLISYLLGFREFGSFTKIITFVSFFYLIVDFGINAIFIKNTKDVQKDFFNLLYLRLIFALLLFLLLILLANILPYNPLENSGFSPSEKFGIVIFGLTLFSQAVYLSLNAVVQKNLIYKKIVFPNVVASLILLLFIWVGVSVKSLDLILVSYFISSVVLCLLLFRDLSENFKLDIKLTNFSKFSNNTLVSSFPLALVLFLNLIYSKADIFILSLDRSTLEVGVYGLSYRFFEFFIAIPAFFSNSIYPILLDTKEEKLFNTLVKKYFGILVLTATLLTVVTIFLTPLLPLIKREYILSVAPLKILSLSLPFFFVTSLLQWLFVIRGKIKILIFIYGTAMLINIFLNIVFIPLYSYIAASVITVVSEALVLILMLISLGLQKVKNT